MVDLSLEINSNSEIYCQFVKFIKDSSSLPVGQDPFVGCQTTLFMGVF